MLFFKSWHGLDIRVAAVNIKAHLVVNHTILLKLAFFLNGVSNSGLAPSTLKLTYTGYQILTGVVVSGRNSADEIIIIVTISVLCTVNDDNYMRSKLDLN